MRLGEAELSERQDLLVDMLGHRLVDLACVARAFQERFVQLLHLLPRAFTAHRPAQRLCLARREPRDGHRHL